MTRQVGVIASSLILCSAVLADRVLTRDGRVLQGKISFGENGDVKVTVPSTTHNITSANLARVFLNNSKSKPGLSDVSFRLYQGNWKQLPDFSNLTVDKSGQMSADRIDLSPLGMNEGPRVFNLKHGETLDRWSAPMIEGRPFSINATVEACGDGVILAQGGNVDGFALFLKDGHLHFVTRNNRELTTARDELPLPLNQPVKIVAELRRDLNLVLTVAGREAVRIESPGMILHRPSEGLSVGFDQRPSLVGAYRNDHHFQGTLKDVQVRLMGIGLVYLGKLNTSKPGEYEFNLSADSNTQLEINSRKVINNPDFSKPTQSKGTIKLAAGSHDLRLVYAQLTTSKNYALKKHLTLEWSGPGLQKQALTAIPHPQAHTWQPADIAIPSAGILTLNGSFIAKPATGVSSTKVLYADTSLARKDVSIIFLRPLSIFEARKLADKRPGVLLMDGTFTEGKLLTLDDNTAAVSSILFGIKRLKRSHEAAAIILKQAPQPTAQKSFRLHDGSLYVSENYSIKNDQVILTDTPFKDHPIPLVEVAEISHSPTPNYFQSAETFWEAHSSFGQNFLSSRTRKSMIVIRQFREAQFKLAASKKAMIEAVRILPALADAEAELLPDYEKGKAERDAVRKTATEHMQQHKPLARAHENATRKLESDCAKIDQAHESLQNFIASRSQPALVKIEKVKEEIRRNGEPPTTKSKLSAAEKQLAEANIEIAKHEIKMSQAVQACYASDNTEHQAMLNEAAAWIKAANAQAKATKVQQDFADIELNYLAKKSAADATRQIMARARREGGLAEGRIGILEPTLKKIYRPK